MKYTRSARAGFLPRMANRMTMVTIVRPIAISGETSAIVFDRSVRFSSTSCMRCLLRIEAASAHQESEFLARGLGRRQSFRKPSVKHYRDPVGDFGELVE